MKAYSQKFLVAVFTVILLGVSACVTKQSYNALQAQYDQLEGLYGSDEAKIVLLEDELKVTMLDTILFPEGGYRLNSYSKSVLDKLVPTLTNLQQTDVIVGGYTDNVPIGHHLKHIGITSNMDLSSKRADEVVNYLISQGISPSIISAEGFGENRPVASNDTSEGRAQNRRIEINLRKSGN